MRRLDQLLASLGYGSRKDAQALCRARRVRVAGVVVDDASVRVEPGQVTLDELPLEFPDGLLVMLHKPVGRVCSHDTREGPRVYDLLPERWLRRDPKVTTIGRLDKDTSGVLLLTDQGALVQRLTSPKHHVEKVYVATLDRAAGPEVVDAFVRGLDLREGSQTERTLPAVARLLPDARVEVTLQEGRYHQVRRMFAALGFSVVALERTRLGDWSLDDLAPGAWRALPLP